MPYTMTIGAILGAGKTGLASVLRAQVVDVAGNAVGAAQAGFNERGTSGSYMVTLTLPASHRGGVDVYATSAPATILAFTPINPEEFEYIDARISAVSAALLDLADGVEAGYTLRQALRLMAAALLGKVSGVSGDAPVFRDLNDVKDRITATTTTDGRTTVTLDPT